MCRWVWARLASYPSAAIEQAHKQTSGRLVGCQRPRTNEPAPNTRQNGAQKSHTPILLVVLDYLIIIIVIIIIEELIPLVFRTSKDTSMMDLSTNY